MNNGGEWDSIESVFNRYYEAENMHVLNPPNGNTAKHLDLLFKIADQNTFLVSRSPESEVLGSSHSRKLAQQLIRTQRNNVEYLERNLPEKKIVTLPMPSLLIKSRTSRLDALRREVESVYLSLYPEARLEWINADDITLLGGSIHCMSVQKMLTTSRILKKPTFLN